jgi:hypothetical protein
MATKEQLARKELEIQDMIDNPIVVESVAV